MGEVERVNATFSTSLANTNYHRVGQSPQRNPRKHQEHQSQDDVLDLHSDSDEDPVLTVVQNTESSDELDLSA